MKIVHKDATITPTGGDEDFPGGFEVILSAPTLDRDGDTLLAEDWKQPLPEHITFDSDHGMSVATTVGSGKPSINDAGELVVSGTYSSLARAQEVRTLVKEGHIRTTSVAFMSEKSSQKDGKTVVKRELLNGSFVGIPSNREALVLSSKSGARNSKTDMAHIQSAHDSLAAAGAACPAPMKNLTRVEVKAIQGSLEATQERVRDALTDAYPDQYVWLRATLPDKVVFDLNTEGSSDTDTLQQSYTDDGSVVTLTGDAAPVDVMEIVTPDPDESSEPPAAADQAAAETAAAKSAAADETDALDMQNRALQTLASVYAPG